MKGEWSKLSNEFRAQLAAVTAKRAKVVIDHILEHGHITTEELRDTYGYNHPPRAARDVREHGIPLLTFSVKGSDGRQIGAYKFDVESKIEGHKLGGRRTWPKDLKESLIKLNGSICAICFVKYESRYLQIDHRVPYEVCGDNIEALVEDFMLVCGSCNRAKSWSCEYCQNWISDHLDDVCLSCYWASPDDYTHVALRRIRRLDITWVDDEIDEYEQLAKMLESDRRRMRDFIKLSLHDSIDNSN